MQRDEKLYPAFKKSPRYVRLLAELDLLRDCSAQSTEEANGNEPVSNAVSNFLPHLEAEIELQHVTPSHVAFA